MKRFFCILTALMMLCACAAAEAATLTVRGNGVVTMTADQAYVIVGVRETSEEAPAVQSAVNAKINAIYEALLNAGVEKKDVGTASLYMYANYDYSGEVERIVGYTATNTLRIQTQQLEKLGEYIDIAFSAGANMIEDVQFTALNSEAAQKEALQLAVQNAFEKAEVMAAAAGMTLGDVRIIKESTDYYSADAGAKYSNERMASGAAVEDATLVQASSLQISAGVVVEFELNEGED